MMMTFAHIDDIDVGCGATYSPCSDCYPATVIRKTRTTITIQDDSYRLVSGSTSDGSAEYEYSRNEDGAVHVCRLTKRGWRSGGLRVSFGHRRYYYDPHF